MKRLWKTTMFGSALRSAIEQHGLERGIREQDLFQRWEEIVGPAIAQQAIPNRLRNGLLWLHVVDSAWRQELSLMRRELVAKINAALGEELVKDIRLR